MDSEFAAMRGVIRKAFRAAVEAVDPHRAVRLYCRSEGDRLLLGDREELDLSTYERIWLVGAGKASIGLAAGVASIFGDRIAGGSIAVREMRDSHLPASLDIWEAGHPYPDIQSQAAASEALRIARSCGPGDMLTCVLSGGASALWAAPPANVGLNDLRSLTTALLRSGARIEEMNTVRKHVSQIAGGQLARASGARRVLTIAISDVIDSPYDVIGSGPTLPDSTTYDDALRVCREYDIRLPPSILRHLQMGSSGEEPESPEVVDPVWSRCSFHVVASIDTAVNAARQALTEEGYRVRVVSRTLRGEAREVAQAIVDTVSAVRSAGLTRQALIWGGETTVQVAGDGQGGRNQELALAAGMLLASRPNSSGITIASLATDGSDGPTDAAGGFADHDTVARGRAVGVDAYAALANNDSYAFLAATGDLLVTGPTGTNVNDLVFAIIS